MVRNREVVLHAENNHIRHQIRRFPQNLRQQQPALRVNLDRLTEVVHPVHQLFLRRMKARDRRQFFLDLFPLFQRVDLCNLAIFAGYVKKRSVVLRQRALEFHGEFKPPFFINARWMVSSKHRFYRPKLLLLALSARSCQNEVEFDQKIRDNSRKDYFLPLSPTDIVTQ